MRAQLHLETCSRSTKAAYIIIVTFHHFSLFSVDCSTSALASTDPTHQSLLLQCKLLHRLGTAIHPNVYLGFVRALYMSVGLGLDLLCRTRVSRALVLNLLLFLLLRRRWRVGLLLDVFPLGVALESLLDRCEQLDEGFCDGRFEDLRCELRGLAIVAQEEGARVLTLTISFL